MLVHALPGVLLVRVVPLQDLPVHHRAGEHVHLVVVLGVRMPQLWRLPVHRADHTPNHRPRRLLHLGETEVRDLGDTLRGDKDVRRLAIAVDDGRLAQVEILEAASNVQHDAELYATSINDTAETNGAHTVRYKDGGLTLRM